MSSDRASTLEDWTVTAAYAPRRGLAAIVATAQASRAISVLAGRNAVVGYGLGHCSVTMTVRARNCFDAVKSVIADVDLSFDTAALPDLELVECHATLTEHLRRTTAATIDRTGLNDLIESCESSQRQPADED